MKTIADTAMLTTPEYRQFIEDLKARVTAARISAARAVNRDLILLYWDIGRGIVEKQQHSRMGGVGRGDGFGGLAAGVSGHDGLFVAQCLADAAVLRDVCRPCSFSHKLCEN